MTADTTTPTPPNLRDRPVVELAPHAREAPAMSGHVDKPWAFNGTRSARLQAEANFGRRDPSRGRVLAGRASAYRSLAVTNLAKPDFAEACEKLDTTYTGASIAYFNGAAREAHEQRSGIRHIGQVMDDVLSRIGASPAEH